MSAKSYEKDYKQIDKLELNKKAFEKAVYLGSKVQTILNTLKNSVIKNARKDSKGIEDRIEKTKGKPATTATNLTEEGFKKVGRFIMKHRISCAREASFAPTLSLKRGNLPSSEPDSLSDKLTLFTHDLTL